ncbi:Sugar lactone lactonase YvrE [Evansella caseinilytica]|uniref:Sugar lactone lactonase YvrE n=1 Tax=Evansella caseinilytica TaxID=1503961 RepID=A0A1H3UQ76_9BACI|nr:SMP-30/gluconolactonase/LRE family protein [Evansella caseinilytica]SDZ64376.1 Sugar lactone lactonase YvrE [Evansella caseinilytica]
MKAELVVDAKAMLGEGPCWDDREQKLYWVDIIGKTVHCYDPETGENQTLHVNAYVGCVVLKEDGGLLAGLQNGIFSIDMRTYERQFIDNPEQQKPENRFNDGKVDPSGRFWAGTMHIDGKQQEGALYRMGSDRKMHKVIDDISISNGLAWDIKQKIMYYIDTPTRKVAAFDYDPRTGKIANKRTAVIIPENEGYPDGMTIDAEGMIWVAHWDGARVSRWNPHKGEKLTEILFPVRCVTSCCFGGKELDELYVTTANDEWNDEAGGLFRVKTTVKGIASTRFR